MDGGGKDLRISVFDILKNRYFLIISITALTYSLSNGFFRSFFPIYIKDYYLLGAAYVSTLYFVRGLFNLFSRPITGSFAGRIGIGRLVFIGMSISVVPFVILYYKPLLPLIVFAMVLSGIGWGMRAVSSVSLISLSLHRDEQDVGMALFYNMFDIGVFIGSTLGGFLSIYLPLNVLFGMYSIVLLVGTIASIHLWNAKV
jgi:predicted MFS family arabinose efflux permease